MRTQQGFGVAFAIFAVASASPIELESRTPGVKFTVEQSFRKPSIKSGPAALASTYNKFKKPAPADVKAAAANNDGTVTANPEVCSATC